LKIINVSSRHRTIPWSRQFPEPSMEWVGWRFIFNGDNEDYDYLVVCDDLHVPLKLRCAPERTIHAGGEPPSVYRYPSPYLKQFAWVITQNTHIKHPGRILYQPGLAWLIGFDAANPYDMMSYRELEALFDVPKTRLISVIASDKTFTSAHSRRFDFARKIKAYYGEKIDLYGRGLMPVNDKLDALKGYRFSIVLENSRVKHYFSEKLTDCIIAGAYPIYFGCPNLKQYFPQNSFARIDINKFASSVETIDNAIKQEFDKKYREELRKARDLAMRKHNFFPMIIDIIKGIESGKYGRTKPPRFFNGRILPFAHQEFQAMFGPKYVHPARRFLVQLANNYKFFNFLYRIYRKVKHGRWENKYLSIRE